MAGNHGVELVHGDGATLAACRARIEQA
jgi:hypothetical protein